MKRVVRLGMILLLFLSVFSCFDADLLDPDKIDTDNIKWRPDMIFPVGNAKITLWDVIKSKDEDSSDIDTTKEGTIVLRHTQEKFASIGMKKVIDIPTSFPSVNAELEISQKTKDRGTIPGELVTSTSLGELAADIIIETGSTDILLKQISASFKLNISLSQQPFRYEIKLSSANIGLDETVLVNRGETLAKVITKNDLDIYLNTSDVSYKNKINIKAEITVLNDGQDIDFGSLNNINLDFSIDNFSFTEVQGNFGNMEIPINTGYFEMEVGDDISDIISDITFADPKISLVMNNENIGIPFSADFDLKGIKEGVEVGSMKKGVESILFFDAPSNVSEYLFVQSKGYDKENSGIVSLFKTFPLDSITYEGMIKLNPIIEPSLVEDDYNFITNDAEMQFDLEIEVPFNLTIDSLIYEYTEEDVDFGIDEDDNKKILEADILLKTRNAWPVGVKISELKFIYTDGSSDSMTDITFLDAPFVNDLGESIVKEKTNKITLDSKMRNKLYMLKDLKIKMEMKTSKNEVGNDVSVSLDTKKILDLVIGVNAKIDMSISNN